MKIRVQKYANKPLEYLRNEIKGSAKFIVSMYKFGAAELAFDQYFNKKYKIGLKAMCKKLIENAHINNDKNSSEYIVTFLNSDDDAIAELITYGNSELFRSNILLKAFTII